MFEGLSLSGFVLVGGNSTRMGRNKALLPWEDSTLAQHIAAEMAQLTATVSLAGSPELYRFLGIPVIPDAAPGRGPLSGMEAALLSPRASEWNLIVACDMPRVNAELLQQLANEAASALPSVDCVIPRSFDGKLQPLCAVYRKRCGSMISAALKRGERRVVDVVAMLQASFCEVQDPGHFQNVNTPDQWTQLLNDR